jgi:hypothetical protein
MISNWKKFNEKITDLPIESPVFKTYIKKYVLSWGLNNWKEWEEIVTKFLDLYNEEFSESINIEETRTDNVIIDPNKEESEWDLWELDDIERPDEIWSRLKYKDYKPGLRSTIHMYYDEDLFRDRYVKYYNKMIYEFNKIPGTSVSCQMRRFPNVNQRYYIVFNILLRFDNFEFKDPFSKENVIDFITNNPQHLNDLYKWGDPDDMFEFIIDNPELKDKLKRQNLLDFTKKFKSLNDPKRRNMEEESQMYVFIARKIFKETDNNYIKDIEIENLVPIDPYDSSYSNIIQMMKLRTRMQGGDSKVYCIWLPKEFDEYNLDNINDESMEKLRKAIDNKKEEI